MAGGDNSLLLIKEEVLNQKRPKLDEKQINEMAENFKDVCQSKIFQIDRNIRENLREKVEDMVPPKTRKAFHQAKFCSFSQSNDDPSKVL